MVSVRRSSKLGQQRSSLLAEVKARMLLLARVHEGKHLYALKAWHQAGVQGLLNALACQPVACQPLAGQPVPRVATHPSISAMWISSREPCLLSSRSTPPSPPPTTRAFLGGDCSLQQQRTSLSYTLRLLLHSDQGQVSGFATIQTALH